MNVLLITFSFPPAGGVGVLRALSFAKYLPENGLRVDVLTARNAPSVGKDLSLLAQVPPAVTVHRSWTLDLPFALRKAIKKLVAGRGAERPASAKATASDAPKGGNPLKRLIGNLLLPDPQVGWLPFAFPAARRIIRRSKIDVVLITVPPFSTVRLVSKLRRAFPTLPIILDFRDEWLTTTINLVSFNNNDRARAVAYRAEAEAVRDASVVVAVTEAARLELMGRYPQEQPEKFRCIPNGFDTRTNASGADAGAVERPSLSSPVGERTVTLTYIGSVYGSTDPSTFVEAVQGLPTGLRRRLRLLFIGHIETAAYRERLLSLGETIELKGFLPQAEALQAIRGTDFLLLITHDRINVAAKFYDYLGGGKPIVAAVHPAGDVRRLLEATRAGRWADVGDANAIRAMLASILADAPAGPGMVPELVPDASRIAAFHRRSLAAQYASVIRAAAGDSCISEATGGASERAAVTHPQR